MKKILLYIFAIIILIFVINYTINFQYYKIAGIAKIILFFTIVFAFLNFIYYILPFRKFKKTRFFSLFPKYKLTIDSVYSKERMAEKLKSFGYKEVSSKKKFTIYSHGFLAGDFSIKFAQHMIKVVYGDEKLDIYIYHKVFVLFDTGDFSKIANELKEKLSTQ